MNARTLGNPITRPTDRHAIAADLRTLRRTPNTTFDRKLSTFRSDANADRAFVRAASVARLLIIYGQAERETQQLIDRRRSIDEIDPDRGPRS